MDSAQRQFICPKCGPATQAVLEACDGSCAGASGSPYHADSGPKAGVVESPSARCQRYRRRILELSQQVSAAHVAPAFSCLEIVDALYHGAMQPQDIFIMSKGHGCLAQYAVLEDLGLLPAGELDAYCKPGGRLGAHPDYAPDLGIHASTGSLGHGLGIGAGQALAEKLKGSGVRVWVLLSDGECQEGSTWEAAMVAANLRLSNLRVIVDYNDFGGMDRMSEAHPNIAPLTSKFNAFGWWAGPMISGHGALAHLIKFNLRADTPSAVVCRTTKGRGVSFMENAPLWHYRSPSAEEYERALAELG
jgi:transketolase